MTPLSLEPAAPVCELPSVWPRPASTRRVSRSCSRRGATRLRHREALMQPWESGYMILSVEM